MPIPFIYNDPFSGLQFTFSNAAFAAGDAYTYNAQRSAVQIPHTLGHVPLGWFSVSARLGLASGPPGPAVPSSDFHEVAKDRTSLTLRCSAGPVVADFWVF